MRFFILIAFLITSLSYTAFPQIDDLKWEKYIGVNNQKIHNCYSLETNQNTIALFALGKRHIHYTELDQQGEVLKEITFPFSKKVTVHSIIPVEEGFLLAGHQNRGRKNIASLWQLKLQERSIQAVATNRDKEGSFQKVIHTNQGDLLITGQLDHQMIVYRLDQQLQQLDEFYQSPLPASMGTTILQDFMGHYLVAGYHLKNKIPYLTIWKIDDSQELINTVYSSSIPHTQALDIVQLDNLDLFVTGIQRNNTVLSNILLQLAPNLNEVEELPSNNTINAAQKIGIKTIQTPPNYLLTAGSYSAFGANTGDIWLSWFSSNRSKEATRPLDTIITESAFEDKAVDLLALENNNYLMTTLSGDRSKPSIKLYYYQSKENICETPIVKLSSKGYHFSPTLDKIALSDAKSISFKGYLLSTESVHNRDISITNKTLSAKAITTVELREETSLPNQYCYHLKTNLRLRKDAVNNIEVQIAKGKEQVYKEEFKQVHEIEKPNLHLITIGINYKLEYTQEDAKDIDALFRTQEGRLFKRVYSYRYHTDEQTEGKPIVDFIDDFSNNRAVQDSITNRDVILLFVSSHGFIKSTPEGKERFILPAKDYIESNRTTYIDYQSDILDKFENIPGKKVILIDACKSGSAKGYAEELSDGIKRILEAPEGFITLSSSQEDQLSYECGGDIKNGVFTYAIEEALSDDINRQLLDVNHDKVISIEELFNHLNGRVPEVAKEYSADDAEQTPELIGSGDGLLRGLPVFFIH